MVVALPKCGISTFYHSVLPKLNQTMELILVDPCDRNRGKLVVNLQSTAGIISAPSGANKGREKFRSQLCIGHNTSKAGESVPERVDELWVVVAKGGGELALLLPAGGSVDQQLHLGVVEPVDLVPVAPNVELVEILRISCCF